MPKEVEKKYLLRKGNGIYSAPAFFEIFPSMMAFYKSVLLSGNPIRQGYLPIELGIDIANQLDMHLNFDPDEARLREIAGDFYFTLKGGEGLSRNELELKVGKGFFSTFWEETKGRRVEKVRLSMPYGEHIAEFDVYTNRFLAIAEVELPSVEIAESLKPLGFDVTEDSSYKNRNLAK